MSKHMTIINLACTITKLRKWGEAWKHSAESAQAATARMHQANKDLERAKVITDGLVDKLIADRDAAWTERDTQAADHSRQLTEHRAAFGARTEADAKIIAGLRSEIGAARMAVLERDSLISERDGLLTQVQDMREEIIRVNEAHGRTKVEHDGLLDELAVQRDAFTANVERIRCEGRDALRAEVEFLKTLRPKYKVGDKLQLYPAIRYTPVTVVGVRTVYDCQADGAEYPVGHSEDELTERYEQTPPEATHAEPDLTQLHAKGKEAWSDVPNATQWVEEMRGNSEATHDTEAGKAAAESSVRTEPVADEIKIGNVVKVRSASGDNTARSDIGKIGEVIEIDSQDGTVLLSGGAGWVSRCDVRKVTT